MDGSRLRSVIQPKNYFPSAFIFAFYKSKETNRYNSTNFEKRPRQRKSRTLTFFGGVCNFFS